MKEEIIVKLIYLYESRIDSYNYKAEIQTLYFLLRNNIASAVITK